MKTAQAKNRDLRKICVKDKRRQYNRLTTGRE